MTICLYNFLIKISKIVEFFNGKGPFTSTGVESVLYMKTNNSISADPGYPDIELLQSFATISFDICKFGVEICKLCD